MTILGQELAGPEPGDLTPLVSFRAWTLDLTLDLIRY
jgi:hypothetical protein